MQIKNFFFGLVFLFTANVSFAQLNANLIGQASELGNNCYIITPDINNQVGGVWYDYPIDFSEDFTIYYQGNFGTKDAAGADGMALVFKGDSNPELGSPGGGLSYLGISPSLIVEFDTWQNGEFGDPSWDHIAIMRNGVADHTDAVNTLSAPVQASATSLNIEDGQNHEIKIEWIAGLEALIVYFDCIPRTQITLDVKNLIFSGDDSVFFGFVGSTGGNSNLHRVCLNRVSFVDDLQLQDETVCEGQSLQIDATIPSGTTYLWTPPIGISNANLPNPIFTPEATTNYTVTITDICGDTVVEQITVNVLPVEDPIFDAVNPICLGDELEPLPLVSNNGITGSWTPELDNTTTTTYTFTPTSNLCATETTLEIIVNEPEEPSFDAIDPICEGDVLADLPTTSNNGIVGVWSPALDNTTSTVYTFTPNDDEACVSETSLEIVVNPITTPQFDIPESSCEGVEVNFPTTSLNGIEGTWSPAFDDTLSATYIFTPLAEECATEISINIQIESNGIPAFDLIETICEGDNYELPTTANNGIMGTWSPAFNNLETTLYTFTPSSTECATPITAEIEVVSSILPVFDYPITSICPAEELPVLPELSNNGISGTWSPALNNITTTTYTFTPDANQGCVVESTLEISVLEPIPPTFEPINSICVGDNLEDLPLVSIDGIEGIWSPALNNLETTTYTFTPNDSCFAETTLTIEVIPISNLTLEVFTISEAFSGSQSVRIDVFGGTGNYEFQLNNGAWQMENAFRDLTGCDQFTVRAREVSNCSNIAVESFRILEFPKFFTPNGDQFNDTWNITCLRSNPSARITIFDRFGKVLAGIKTNEIGWDGTYNSKIMPSNDYWFKVEYLDDNNRRRTFTSNFSLIR